MVNRNRMTLALRGLVTTLLCAALLTTGAMAANATLQTIDVTPAVKSISIDLQQSFKATGTLSDGSKQSLGPAIGNIAPGHNDTCTLLTSGGVECWGANYYGQLGNGSNADSLIPRPVRGISTAMMVAPGYFHGCALLSNGTVQCWGYNSNGELGNGTYKKSYVPVPVTGISTATGLASGGLNSCALLASGAVQCWGEGRFGQLGDGSYMGSNIPESVTGISTATSLAWGFQHVCALLSSGAVQCWGATTVASWAMAQRLVPIRPSR